MSTEIHGFCDERFAPLREAFAANFRDGFEIGASLALTHEGKSVVDLWAGHADLEGRNPWRENTICGLLSGTKILMSTAMLILVDRGLIELDAPIARYWPEFAQGGKAADRVRDALGHCTGAPGLDPPASWDVVCDWDAITARIAAQPHWFDGRRQVCYHIGVFGYILGEIIRRVDGRRPRQFCAEEITRKIGADLSIGIAEPDFARAARLQFPAGPPPDPPSALVMRLRNSFARAPDWRVGAVQENPSGNGFGNGRSLARVCAILANGGTLDGIRFFSPGLAAQAGEENSAGDCPQFGPIRWGLGFALPTAQFAGPSATAYWWGGFGGTRGLIDPRARISMGYVPNNLRIAPGRIDEREERLQNALETVLAAL